MESDESVSDGFIERLRASLAGRYEIGAEIGRGAAAVVVGARDTKHDRDVAIKVLRPDVARALGSDRFLREIRLVARLSHPHIVALFDSAEAEGLLYYVMPLVEGGESLRRRLMREQQLPLDEALRVTRDVAAALQYAHDHGVLHRDVKPENILLAPNVASLADFGLARLIQEIPSERRTGTGLAVGTAAYMSPEQATGGAIDARADQYALACVLYEMLTGEPPFHGRTAQAVLARHRSDPPPSVRTVRPLVPQAIDDVVQRALSKVAADRYATVGELVRALEGAVTSETLALVRGARAAAATGTATAWRRPVLAGVGAVGVAAIAFVLWRTWGAGLGAPTLDVNRIAIAPFELFGVPDTVWRNGLVDVLARNFDGAGPLRTVSASTAIGAWHGRSDPVSAEAFARRTGAGLVIFGQLLGVSADSVRLRATLWDVDTRRSIADLDITDEGLRMGRLADSLTVRILRTLSQSRAIGAVPRVTLGSTSLPVLRLFLQGEQLLRRNDYAGARTAYEQAVGLDSTFALGFRRMRTVHRALGTEFDSVSFAFALRAGRLNRGLAPRDSLLLLADSLAASLPRRVVVYDTSALSRLRRRFAVLEAVAQAYPDAESWNELGEARHHQGEWVGETPERALEALERAISLDPGYAEPYFHAVELGLGLRSVDSVAKLAGEYLRRVGDSRRFRTAATLLGDLRRGRSAASASIARLGPDDLMRTAYLLRRLRTNPRLSEEMYRSVVASTSPEADAHRASAVSWLAWEFLYQGRARAASEIIPASVLSGSPLEAVHLAEAGAMSADSAHRLFTRWARGTDWRAVLVTLAWWARSSDTSSLLVVKGRFDSLSAAPNATPSDQALAQYGATAALQYVHLVRSDTGRALETALTLPDSLCTWTCWPQRELTVRLLLRRGRARDAARFLDAHPPSASPFLVTEVRWHYERARVAVAMGDLVRARTSFEFVRDAWARADPALKTASQEASEWLAADSRRRGR